MSRRWRMVHGKTHSWGASEAEKREEYPITHAVEAVYRHYDCKQRGIPKRVVRQFLEEHCNRGWHHVAGKNGVREVPYYATRLTDELERQLLSHAKG